MKLSGILSLLACAIGLVQSSPVSRAAKPPYMLLVGDSTVAVNGGWGDGLLAYIKGLAEGENLAKSGTTTSSWKSNGRWNALLQTVNETKTDYEPIVTLQFGHNDQKYLTLDEYRANLVNMTTEIKRAGGTPVGLFTEFERVALLANE